MDTNERVREIRRRMAVIRRDLDENVNGIVENVNEMTQLQYYMRNYPWLLLGGAAALGYWAIPKQYQIHSPDPETLEKLAKRNRLVISHKAEPQQRGGVVGGLFSMLSTMALRGAMAYAGAKIGDLFEVGEQANGSAGGSNSNKVARPATADATSH